MTLQLTTPTVDRLPGIADTLRRWQVEGSAMQLHPGDLGWYWRTGAESTAAALRLWSRGQEVVAIGLLDGPRLFRLALAPGASRAPGLGERIATDAADPTRGVLPAGEAAVEAPAGSSVRDGLAIQDGWTLGEAWVQLRRDLTDPVDPVALRVERVAAGTAEVRTEVHRAAFAGSSFGVEKWRAMAAGAPYADARCLVGFDEVGAVVAAATLWSAGPGRPGILEPVGVHADHRGRGYGTAIAVAAAAELQRMGSSSAMVCTPVTNAAAVATYTSAGYQPAREVPDYSRQV